MVFHVVFLMVSDKPFLANFETKLEEEGIATSAFYGTVFPNTQLWRDHHYSRYGQERLADHLLEILEAKK